MKLRSRLMLHLNGLLLVTVALITGVAMFGTVESLHERARQDALDTAWLLANAASMAVSPLPRVEPPAAGERRDADDAARSLAERNEWRRAVKRLAENPTGAGNLEAIFVAKEQAQLLAWSAPDKTADLVSDYWRGIDAIAKESAANRAPIARFLGQSVISSVPLKHRGNASWVFVCKFDTRRSRAAVAPALWRSAKLSLIGLLAGGLVSSLLARQICKPIRKLADAATVIGSGDFNHRVRVEGDANDELGVLAGSFNRMADSLESTMQRLARTEAEKRAQQREMEIAREIQKSLLPESCPQIENFDLAAFSAPASEVGGDFYDFIPLPSGRWGVVIADAMGKGVPAALLMALSRCLIRAYSYGEPSVLKALELANTFLSKDTRSNMFITCFYMVVDPVQDTLTYVNAGHNPAVVTSTRGDVLMLHASGVPLGIFTETGLKEETCLLAPGDVAVLYTDGITEATDASGEFFGSRRLEEIIRNTRQCAVSDICHRIITAVAAFSGNAAQHDDMTMVVLKAKERAPGALDDTRQEGLPAAAATTA